MSTDNLLGILAVASLVGWFMTRSKNAVIVTIGAVIAVPSITVLVLLVLTLLTGA